jgi:hypothetical protein
VDANNAVVAVNACTLGSVPHGAMLEVNFAPGASGWPVIRLCSRQQFLVLERGCLDEHVHWHRRHECAPCMHSTPGPNHAYFHPP